MKKFSLPHLPLRTPRRLAVGLLLSSVTFVALAHAGLNSIGSSEVGFLAVGPAGLKIEGTGSGLSAKEAGGNVTVDVPLSTLETGISLRDKHLKDALNVSKHPKATFSVARSALKFPEDGKTVEASGQGTFNLNGTSKSSEFKYKVSRTGSDYHVQGAATIDITDFKIEKPCYLGVCVDKDVKVKVKFKLRDK